MAKAIKEAQEEIIGILNELDDWLFQYEFLLEVAGGMTPLDEAEKMKIPLCVDVSQKRGLFVKWSMVMYVSAPTARHS